MGHHCIHPAVALRVYSFLPLWSGKTRGDCGATAALHFTLIYVRSHIRDSCHTGQISSRPFLACESTALDNSQEYKELCYT